MKYKQIRFIAMYVAIISIFFVSIGYAASLIAREDFEDQDFADFFHAANSSYWNQYSIVTSNPHSGSYSLRGNACGGCIDPITGKAGNNRTNLNFGNGGSNPALGTSFDLDSLHNDELYFDFWMKYDSNFDTADGYSSNKIWWMQFEGDTNTYYVQFRGTSLSFYDETGYQRESYRAISPNAVDGQWHRFRVYMRYNTSGSDNGILRVWFDSSELVNISNCKYLTTSSGKMSRVAFGYFHNNASSSSGWQIDDIEIWDGLPSSNKSDDSDKLPESNQSVAPVTDLKLLAITTPANNGTYNSNKSSIDLKGIVNGFSDFTVSWVNSLGGSGSGVVISTNTWEINDINLTQGTNNISVTVTGLNNKSVNASIDIIH
jgi:hypothetical protein